MQYQYLRHRRILISHEYSFCRCQSIVHSTITNCFVSTFIVVLKQTNLYTEECIDEVVENKSKNIVPS